MLSIVKWLENHPEIGNSKTIMAKLLEASHEMT